MIENQLIKQVKSPEDHIKCQIAVIGSGSGGAITACILAEAGLNVLLIEEGSFLSLDSCEPFSLVEMVKKYRNGGITAAFGNPKIQYVEGRCVGGGSEINSGLYHRTPPEILSQWQQEFDVKHLEEKDLLPHFIACEEAVNVSYLPYPASPASLKLDEGAKKLGWQSLEIPRWFKYFDSSVQERKQSMTETFIPQALKAGCQLLANTKITKLQKNHQKWQLRGIYQNSDYSQQFLTVEAETVFVCGGAIQTPALLRRSGITHNTGNSLQMHPTVKVVARFPEIVNSKTMGVPVHQVKEFFPRFSFGCSISSSPYLALAIQDYPQYRQEVEQYWQNMAVYYAAITPQGKGTIRCLPGFKDPLIRYNLTQNDLKTLSQALQKLSLLLLEANASVLYPSIKGEKSLTNSKDVANLPASLPQKQTNLMTVHVFSSCPMGENVSKCATDSFGKVHNMENLYISDASLLCTAPGVNPQGSIMAIARRNALKFIGKL